MTYRIRVWEDGQSMDETHPEDEFELEADSVDAAELKAINELGLGVQIQVDPA